MNHTNTIPVGAEGVRLHSFASWFAAAAIVLGGCSTGGCGASKSPIERHSRTSVDPADHISNPGLTMGDYQLKGTDAVLDGDTIKVTGVNSTLRLLGIDTEETYKNKDDRRNSARNFKKYLEKNRGDSFRPKKAATPMGEEGKEFAKAFFKDAKVVRLERDHPKEIRGMYGRYLTYVFAEKNGKWVNYNIECVRAGMSPYFMKYGYSRRFHDEFVTAEAEAKAAKRGIWNPDAEGYKDYEERIKWWTARGDFARGFDKLAAERDDYIVLTNWDAVRRIEEHVGNQITVLATVDRIKFLSKGLTRVDLARRQFKGFPIIFFDRAEFNESGIADRVREFVAIRGKVSLYKGRPQLEVQRADQVQLSILPKPSKETP